MNGTSRKLIIASLFFICFSFVLSSGVAEAATTVTATHLTIDRTPRGSVHSGTMITIFGRLRSERASCRSGQTIRLFQLVGGPVQVGNNRDERQGQIHVHTDGQQRLRVPDPLRRIRFGRSPEHPRLRALHLRGRQGQRDRVECLGCSGSAGGSAVDAGTGSPEEISGSRSPHSRSCSSPG